MRLRWPKFAAEISVTVAALSGWFLLTAGIAALLSPARSRALWLVSGGLLLISLCGWKFLRTIVVNGLYALTRTSNA